MDTQVVKSQVVKFTLWNTLYYPQQGSTWRNVETLAWNDPWKNILSRGYRLWKAVETQVKVIKEESYSLPNFRDLTDPDYKVRDLTVQIKGNFYVEIFLCKWVEGRWSKGEYIEGYTEETILSTYGDPSLPRTLFSLGIGGEIIPGMGRYYVRSQKWSENPICQQSQALELKRVLEKALRSQIENILFDRGDLQFMAEFKSLQHYNRCKNNNFGSHCYENELHRDTAEACLRYCRSHGGVWQVAARLGIDPRPVARNDWGTRMNREYLHPEFEFS